MVLHFTYRENPIISQISLSLFLSPGFCHMGGPLLFLEHEEHSSILSSTWKSDICMAHSLSSFKIIVKCHIIRPHLSTPIKPQLANYLTLGMG